MTEKHQRLYERPLARAHALVESWAGDNTLITRSDAAALLDGVLDPTGWTEIKQVTASTTLVPAGAASVCPSDCAPDCRCRCHTGRPGEPAVTES